ncbi:MAG TPA: lysozyme inhibitor LprI family protein [Edaphobacter sp.]
MRGFVRALLVCSSLCLPIWATPQNNSRPAASPALKAYQAKQTSLQRRGAKALSAEYAREKAPSCENATDSNSKTSCVGTEFQITDRNYEAYAKAIAELLRLRDPEDPDSAMYPDRGKEFDRSERLWIQYREVQCQTFGDGFYGGSIQPLEILGCKQDLTRSHMRELANLYKDLFD